MSFLPKPVHVAIGIPMDDGMTNAGLMQYQQVLAGWGLRQSPKQYRFSLLTNTFVRPVEYARNLLVRDFLRTDASYLWFIDADMIPTSSTTAIFEVDADMVCGRAHAYQDMPGGVTGVKISAHMKEKDSDLFVNILPTPDDPVVMDVEACGTASLLIKRHVLEDPRMYLPTTYVNGDGQCKNLDDEKDKESWAPAVFRSLYKPNGMLLRGEDMDFTYRATRLGYSLKVHLGAEIGHFKKLDVDGVERAGRQALIRHGQRIKELMQAEVLKEAPHAKRLQAV